MRLAGAGGRTRRRHPAPVSPKLGRLGERIRAARQEAGLSQSKLGAPHFTRAYVSALELGKVQPSMKSLEFLADRLGKPVSYFMEDPGEGKRKREREFEMLRAKDLIARGLGRDAIALLEPLLADEQPDIEVAHLRRLIGLAYWTARDGRNAVSELTASIEILERLGRTREIQRARRDLAAALLEVGLADRALAIYRRLLEEGEAEPTRDPIFRMAVLRGLGAAYSVLGDPAAAIAYFEQALHLAQDVGDLTSLGRIYSGLAYGYWLAGDHEAAIGHMQRAIANHQNAKDLGAVGELHNNLGVICLEQNHLERAKEHVHAGQQIAEAIGRTPLTVHLMNTEAEIALAERCLDDAQSICERSARLSTVIGFDRGRAGAHRLLGRIAAERDQRDMAETMLTDAAQLFEGIQMRGVAAECLYELSRLAAKWGDVGKSAMYAGRAYELSRAKAPIS